MNVLHLTLKKRWFDMIATGEKKEEYREIKPYWNNLLNNKKFHAIQFRSGYSSNSPTILVELREHLGGLGITEWGAPEGEVVHILRLGRILKST